MTTIATLLEVWTWIVHSWTVVVAIAYVLAVLSLPSVLFKRRGRPQAAMSWVLILFLLPVVGLFCWWLFGRQHLARRRRKKKRSAERFAHQMEEIHDKLPDLPSAETGLLPIRWVPREESLWIMSPTRKNRIRLLCCSDEVYPQMKSLIESAEDHIHLLYYIWRPDNTGTEFRDLLIEKATSGVKVRLLLDAVGSADSLKTFLNPLRAAGARVETFMPPAFFRRRLEINFRNHRKLLVVDAKTAILGGLNIGNEYRKNWHDAAVMLEGPCVDHAQEVFADDWYFTTNEDFVETHHFGNWETFIDDDGICGLVASGPHTELNFTRESMFMAINEARRRVYISTPYLVPDQAVLSALRSAALRGLDVRIVVPKKSDLWLADLASRSYFPELLRGGVRIFRYLPGVMHAKTALFDDDLCVVGSANLDIRSFRLNFELSCYARSKTLGRQLETFYEETLSECEEVSRSDIEQTPYFSRVAESAAHLLSPML